MTKRNKIEISKEQLRNFNSSMTIVPEIGESSDKNQNHDQVYNPFDHRDKTNATSSTGATMHIMKSSLGSGILAMPIAIKYGGLITGGIGTILIGLLCAHTVHILVKSSHVLCRRTKTPSMSYSETAAAAFRCGPKPLRKLDNFMRLFVDWGLCATYLGGVSCYISIIATNFMELGNHYTESNDTSKDKERMYTLIIAPMIILLGQIRSIKFLVPFSMIANFCLSSSLVIAGVYVVKMLKPLNELSMWTNWDDFPKFFSIVLFSMEGIGTVLHVENNMDKPKQFLGCPSVLSVSMTVIITFFGTVGIMGYIGFGEETKETLSLNIPIDDFCGKSIRFLVAVSVLLTYGLQFYVCADVVWLATKKYFGHNIKLIVSILQRILMTLFTVLLAYFIPNLTVIVGIVASVFFSILGVFVPALIEILSCWDNNLGTFNWRLWKNFVIMFLALYALCIGSASSIKGIMEIYQKPPGANVPLENNSTLLTSLLNATTAQPGTILI